MTEPRIKIRLKQVYRGVSCEVEADPTEDSLEEIVKAFFETHKFVDRMLEKTAESG